MSPALGFLGVTRQEKGKENTCRSLLEDPLTMDNWLLTTRNKQLASLNSPDPPQ